MSCKPNPFIEHGFDRSASHSSGDYVCICEYKDRTSIEQDLQSMISYVHHNFDCGIEISSDELDELIRIASSLKWENENGH